MRTFLNNELDQIAKMYHPHEMDAERFINKVQNSLEVFLVNMEHLKIASEEKLIEQWMETFLAWFELNTKDKT